MKTSKVLISTFQKIEDNLSEAFEKNELTKITELLSDNWTILEYATGLSDKKSFINAIKQGRLVQTSMVKEVIDVKITDSTAIVISKGRYKGLYLGKSYDTDQWVTNCYIKENENWVCFMTVEMPLKCQKE